MKVFSFTSLEDKRLFSHRDTSRMEYHNVDQLRISERTKLLFHTNRICCILSDVGRREFRN